VLTLDELESSLAKYECDEDLRSSMLADVLNAYGKQLVWQDKISLAIAIYSNVWAFKHADKIGHVGKRKAQHCDSIL